ARLYAKRLPAAQAFARANGIDRVLFSSPRPRLGIVTAGKAMLDVRQALDELGIDAERAAEFGLVLYKVGMTWPLEPERMRAFCAGLEDVLVVEEKRPIVEDQIARVLYNEPSRPRLLGKREERGEALVPGVGELTPSRVAEVVRGWLERRAPGLVARPPSRASAASLAPGGLVRLPAFCSGCPHNTSTVVPDGSLALGG